MNRKTPTVVGAAIGLALFLAIALLPALLYGGYAGVLLAGGIFGTPVQPTFLVRALIVFGMVMGVTGVGSLFAVGGAVAGAAVGVLAEPPPSRRRRPPPRRQRLKASRGDSGRQAVPEETPGPHFLLRPPPVNAMPARTPDLIQRNAFEIRTLILRRSGTPPARGLPPDHNARERPSSSPSLLSLPTAALPMATLAAAAAPAARRPRPTPTRAASTATWRRSRGRRASVPAEFGKSVHGCFGCTDCHADYQAPGPHELAPLAGADAALVARFDALKASTAPRAYLACGTCHAGVPEDVAGLRPRPLALEGPGRRWRHLRRLPRLAARAREARSGGH